jgi:hypothetical protein
LRALKPASALRVVWTKYLSFRAHNSQQPRSGSFRKLKHVICDAVMFGFGRQNVVQVWLACKPECFLSFRWRDWRRVKPSAFLSPTSGHPKQIIIRKLANGKSATALPKTYLNAGIGVQLFASVKYGQNLDRQVNFRSFSNSFLFLFQVLTGKTLQLPPILPPSLHFTIGTYERCSHCPSLQTSSFPFTCPAEASCPLL